MKNGRYGWCLYALLSIALLGCASTTPTAPVKETAVQEKGPSPRTVTYMPNFELSKRPVGHTDTFHLTLEFAVIRRLEVPGQEPRQGGHGAKIVTRLEERVAEVLSDGEAKVVIATFHDLEVTEKKDGIAKTNDLSGVPLEVVMWPKLSVTRTDGVELTPLQNSIVYNSFTRTDPDAESLNRVYAPKSPVELGESWSLDGEAWVRNAVGSSDEPFVLSSAEGQLVIKRLKTLDGVPCLEIEGKGRAEINEAPGMDDVQGGIQFEVAGDFRADGKPSRLSSTTKQVMVLMGRVPGGVMKMQMYRERSVREIASESSAPKSAEIPPPAKAAN